MWWLVAVGMLQALVRTSVADMLSSAGTPSPADTFDLDSAFVTGIDQMTTTLDPCGGLAAAPLRALAPRIRRAARRAILDDACRAEIEALVSSLRQTIESL